MKKDDVPHVSFETIQRGNLKPIAEGCSIVSNIDSFIDCHEQSFELILAVMMFIYKKNQGLGVVEVIIDNKSLLKVDDNIEIDCALDDLFKD